MKVYLVIHHEIMSSDNHEEQVDPMLFHTASSFPNAIAYIKKSRVEPYSWWEIQEQTIDDFDWPVHVGWFGLRGGKLRKMPIVKAIEIYRKCKADPSHPLNA